MKTKMTTKQAVKYGILPKKFFQMRDGLRVCAAKAMARAGKVEAAEAVRKEADRKEVAEMIARCFKKHGFGRQTRRLLENSRWRMF